MTTRSKDSLASEERSVAEMLAISAPFNTGSPHKTFSLLPVTPLTAAGAVALSHSVLASSQGSMRHCSPFKRTG